MAGSSGGGKTRRTGASAKRAKSTRGTKVAPRKAVGSNKKSLTKKKTLRAKKKTGRSAR